MMYLDPYVYRNFSEKINLQDGITFTPDINGYQVPFSYEHQVNGIAINKHDVFIVDEILLRKIGQLEEKYPLTLFKSHPVFSEYLIYESLSFNIQPLVNWNITGHFVMDVVSIIIYGMIKIPK